LLCLISQLLSASDDLSTVTICSFRAGDDPHNVNGLDLSTYPSLPLRLGDEARDLDFQTSSDKRCQRTKTFYARALARE